MFYTTRPPYKRKAAAKNYNGNFSFVLPCSDRKISK